MHLHDVEFGVMFLFVWIYIYITHSMHDTIPCFAKRHLFAVIIYLISNIIILYKYNQIIAYILWMTYILRGLVILFNKLLSTILITNFIF